MKVILDASIVIDFLRRNTTKEIFSRKVIAREDLVISLVTVAELYSGKSAQREGKAKDLLEKIIGTTEIIIPILDDAKKVGKLRDFYQLSLGDAFIAELAIRKNYPLATLDKKAFRKIKGLRLYPLVP